MKYDHVAFGADPELFLIDHDGKYRSAIGLIGGSKQNPRPIDDLGSAVQEDNVAVEFNIIPAMTKEDFRNNVAFVMNYLNKHAESMALQLAVVPAVMFDADQLEHPSAQEFGCDPDFNVWTKQKNPRPQLEGDMKRLRSCGGHIHVSWSNPIVEDQTLLIQAMDLFLGCPSVEYDGDRMRRALYGKAGAFRFKNYGVEYRTLSNFWIKSPDMVDWAYDQTERAVDYLNGGGVIDEEHYDMIQETINNNNEHTLNQLRTVYPI